jgi:gluconokinase
MSSALDETIEPAAEIALLAVETVQPVLLSLDVGTSGVRAALFDPTGQQVPGTQRNTSRHVDAISDFAELDPDLLVDEVIQTIDALLDSASLVASKIEFIAISTFWHSLLGVDSDGTPTTGVLTWADTRAAKHATSLRDEFNEKEIHARTGCRFHSSYWPAKLRWLRQEQPESFNKTAKWIGFAEYLSFRLFGSARSSVSMASATGIFDQQRCEWDKQFVSDLGLSPESLPEIDDDYRPQLRSEFVVRWPILADARLAAVIGDGAANNIGGGCSSNERIALMVGTSGAMRVVCAGESPVHLSPALWSYRVTRDRIVVGGALSDGGGLYRWLTESLRVGDADEIQRQLAALEPDAHGLTLLPFWSGERSTGWSSASRGGIFGLTQLTTPIEIVRAALEAIAYRFALINQALDQIAPNATLIATGNALRASPVWLQIMADVLKRRIVFGGAPEASMRGAALLALEAVGKIGSIEEVPISVDQVFEPDMSRHARYQEGLSRQEELYERLFTGK